MAKVVEFFKPRGKWAWPVHGGAGWASHSKNSEACDVESACGNV